MEKQNKTNEIWQETIERVYEDPHYISAPRGMEVHERLGDGYGPMPMPAFLDLSDRKVNTNFMFNEAAWILSGSNRVEDLTGTMESYKNYSDDGITLSGAYGPKVVDQLRYVVDSIENDNDTRQAVMNIWRERPGQSKDIPCTLSMQFIMRDKVEYYDELDLEGNLVEKSRAPRLNAVVTMRSNDVILGVTYDVFSFSMVANAVRLLLSERGIDIPLDEDGKFGDLYVNPGSLHIYERHYDKVDQWKNSRERDASIGERVIEVMKSQTYLELIKNLERQYK